MTEERSVALVGDALDIPNLSMAKDISDLVASTRSVLSPDEVVRIDRLKTRLTQLGKTRMSAMQYRAAEAELLYEVQQEEDWKLLIDPYNENAFRTWYEFRVPLATIMGVSTGTIGFYLKIVRYARQVLGIPPGELHEFNGIVTVKHMLDVTAGHDGRASDDLAVTVRPISTTFASRLQKDYGELGDPEEVGWKPYLRAYYYTEVAHVHDDPSAINLTPGELAAKARDETGKPEFVASLKIDDDGKPVYKILVKLPDFEEEDGSTIVGEMETYQLRFDDSYVSAMVRDWVSQCLKVKDR
jgi:hypothetical protein